MGVFFPVLLLLCSIFSIQSTAQNLGFRCTNTTSTATCNSLIDYKLPNTTTLASILNLFEIKNLRSLLAANNLPITTPQTLTLPASQILKIPFPCACRNGTGISNRRPIYTVVPDDGLFHIAAEVFSNLVTYQQIQSVNNIPDANNISIGQKLRIPLRCSCDGVNGDTVVHYGHLVAAGDLVSGYAERFNTTQSTLLSLNGLNNSADLKADSIFDEMDMSNFAVGDSSLQSGDWRAQLQAAARERMVSRIMVILKRHLPCYGPEGLQNLRKISERLEEKILNAATSRSDYLRRISLKMLTIDPRPRRPMPLQSNSGANVNPSN